MGGVKGREESSSMELGWLLWGAAVLLLLPVLMELSPAVNFALRIGFYYLLFFVCSALTAPVCLLVNGGRTVKNMRRVLGVKGGAPRVVGGKPPGHAWVVGSRGGAARAVGMLLGMARGEGWGWLPGFKGGFGGFRAPPVSPSAVVVCGTPAGAAGWGVMLGCSLWHACGEGTSGVVSSKSGACAV